MKTKKIIIIAVSVVLSVVVVAFAGISIAANIADMTVGEYLAMMLKNRDKVNENVLVTVNGEDISIFGVEASISLYQETGTAYDYIEKDIDLFVDRILLRQEAEKRGLVVPKEDVDKYIQGQKDVYVLAPDDPFIIASLAAFEKLGITVDEYYDSEDMRKGIENFLLAWKVINDESKKQGAVTTEEIEAVRNELVKKLRAEATIVFNQSNLNKLKQQAIDIVENKKQ